MNQTITQKEKNNVQILLVHNPKR